jgi:hypothetical protein
MRIPVIHLRNAAISAFMSACTAALCAGSALAASSDTVGVLPTPAPLRSTTSAAKPARVHAFVAGDVSFGTRVYNELAPGATGESMFETKGALTYALGSSSLLLGGDLRAYRYDHGSNFGFLACSLLAVGSAPSSAATSTIAPAPVRLLIPAA